MSTRAPHIAFVEMSTTGAGERALDYCAEMGYAVSLITRAVPKEADGREINVVACETNDHQAVEKTVVALHREHPIDGVTTTQDLYTAQAALAAEVLGLRGNGYSATCGVRNKYRMRLRLQESCPELNPQFAIVQNERDARDFAARVGYPLIAKPQDANDSWAVVRVDREEQLVEYMERAATWRSNASGQALAEGVLLEDYIEGEEYMVDTAQHDGGPLTLLGITGKELVGKDGRYFAEISAYLPSGGDEEGILSEVGRALAVLGIRCGVVHTECRVRDGEVKIIEVNPRLAGDMLGSHMFEAAFGANPIEQVVEIALGHSAPWRPTRRRAAALYGITVPFTGVFHTVRNVETIKKADGVEALRLTVPSGTECHFPPESNLDFVGRLVAVGDTADEALSRAKQAAQMSDVEMAS